MNKKQISIAIASILAIVLIAVGTTYAYFTASSGGDSNTTVTLSGGSMTIVYNGGDSIEVLAIVPDNNPFATKVFTVTGNNTMDVEMAYKISLVIEANTFSENALKYKLTSVNTNTNGATVPSVLDLTSLGTENIDFGIGHFDSPTSGDKVHTYTLDLYFPETGEDQNKDQGKEFKAYVLIENAELEKGNPLGEEILAQGGGAAAIEAKGTPSFSSINGTSGLYASTDDYGKTYYYRGLKDDLNNNLIWGGFQWKIVRINGDNSVKLVYNGTCPNNSCTINSTGDSTQIAGTHAWNTTNYDDAKYVGYMYGGANGSASTIKNGTTSTSATYNQTSTNAKTELENWYNTNIKNKSFESDVVDSMFCNDRSTYSGNGYGKQETYYGAYNRLLTNKTPNLKCSQKNDRFTKSDTVNGNGALTHPVGLLTADEAAMAGLVYGQGNSTNYLYTNKNYWLFSPSYMHSYGGAIVFNVNSDGSLDFSLVPHSYGLRPAVSISVNTKVSGSGSQNDPYKAI